MDYYTTCSTLLKVFWVLGPFALFYDAPFGRFGDGASRFSLNGGYGCGLLSSNQPQAELHGL